MLQLKPLSREAVPAALQKAHLYRQVNEPQEAESICRDVLKAEPRNQEATIRLLLSLTDQFREETATIQQVLRIIPSIDDEYERLYFSGVAFERWAKSQHRRGIPGTVAIEWYNEALSAFEKAEALRPPGNDDALLRWNSCVRSIRSDEYLKGKFSRMSLGGGKDLD